jgi:hypothetical protein
MMAKQGLNFGPFWRDGPSAGSFYNFPGNSTKTVSADIGRQHLA